MLTNTWTSPEIVTSYLLTKAIRLFLLFLVPYQCWPDPRILPRWWLQNSFEVSAEVSSSISSVCNHTQTWSSLMTDQFIAPLDPARYLHFRFIFSLSWLHALWSDQIVTFTWFSSWVIHFLLYSLLGRCSSATLRRDGKFSSYSNLRDLRSISSFISVADGTLSLHQKVCSSVSIIEVRFYCVCSSIGTEGHTPVSD